MEPYIFNKAHLDLADKKGWDAFAQHYASFDENDRVYWMTKDLAHLILEKELGKYHGELHVLDVNCGTGNDFDYFFSKGWKVTATDGSEAMLAHAYAKYENEIKSGQLQLFLGDVMDIDKVFASHSFDLVYGITGAYSYLNDNDLKIVHQKLSKLIMTNGLVFSAHLTPFSIAESMYHILHFNFKNAGFRWKKNIKVKIKGVEYLMYLRSKKHIDNIKVTGLKKIAVYPLLALTAPYQTGFRPGKGISRFLYRLEKKIIASKFWRSIFSHFSDQVVFIYKKISKSN